MKLKSRVKKTAFTLTITVLLALNFFQTAFAPPLPIGDPAYLQKECFDSNPTTGTYDQVGTPTGAIENAFDGDLDTNINFQYGAGDGYVQVSAFKRPSDNGLVDFSITFVDLKIHYRAGGTGIVDDRYRIVAYVDPSATPIILQDWVTGTDAAYPPGISTNPAIRVFSNVSEPNDGVWNWNDLASLRVRFEIEVVNTNNFQRVYEHEVWVTAYSTPYPEPGTMSVQTPIIGGLTAGDLFYVDIYITNVEKFWGYEFVLTFDPAILAPIEYISYSPFVSGLPSEIGPNYVSVSYGTYSGDPVGFTGNTPIARIYFGVVADGASLLSFSKADGADIYGNSVTFTPRNGLFASSAVRDVAVIDVKASPAEVRAGESVEIDAVVANQGTSSETFDVTAFYDSTSIGTQTVTGLGSGLTVDLSFAWNTAGVAVGLYQIRVEADVVPDETDTADNTFTDGTVSVLQPSQYTRLYLPNQWITDGAAMEWHADDNSWPYTLPFDFPFYGTYYTTIYISSNGLITFTGPDSSFINSIDALAGKLAIAVAWDDLATYEPRDIFIWQSDSTHVIIRWHASPLYNTALTVDFEAILSANGAIQFNYGYNDGSISATVGISNGVDDIIAEDITNCNYTNTILFTPYRPEHDLSVHLEAPWYLLPGQSTILNATLDNLGLNDESEVELELRINDEIASSVVIPELISGSSYTLSQEWTPTAEGTYDVTAYALPVPDEEYTGNNVASVNVRVCFAIAVAVLDSWDIPGYFIGGLNNDYQPLVDALNVNGFHARAVTNEDIISGILSSFEVFVMVDNVPNEAAVPYVVAFWSNGGGVVAFDSSICFLNYAGILPPESAGSNGHYLYWDYETSRQARISSAHPITAGYEVGQFLDGMPGDAEYRVDALANTSAYPYYTMLVEDVTRPNRAYVSAYEPLSSGKVVHIWDQSHWRNTNLHSMILNAMEWAKAPRYEHDLAASLVVPAFLRLDHPTMINATVRNRGLNNENNVELYILINGAVVDSVLIPELLTASSYTLSYLWTQTIEGNYNITAHVIPVPDEADTTNNRVSSFVTVVRPLIQPVEGQWANYTISTPYGQMLINASYSHYLSPTQMYVDLWLKDPYGNTQTNWLTLNILNRQVEAGIWAGYWYPLWIENDVAIGSTVGILSTNGTVTTSRFKEVGDFLVDCWGAQFQYYDSSYTFWFDKANGLVVAVDITYSHYNYTEMWRLTATNVPLNYVPRIRIQTDPQSGPVGTEVTITGTNATPNGSVEIYWDNTLIGTRTTDESGDFVFTFAVTPCTIGPHSIIALDLTTNVTDTSVFMVLPSISIAPLSGPMGSRVEVTGLGFGANEPVVLCFDGMQIGTVYTDDTGSFTATVNIPISQSGLHLIKAWYGSNYAHATFTVTDVSPLDVNMEVGAIYFKGETVEFYVQTAFKGKPVDATSMTNTLYMPDGTTQALTYERIATGLYRIRYTVSGKGSMTGTYTLVVEASFVTDTVNAYGTSITTFIVKPTWERETPRMAALSVASIGLVSAMVLLWRKEKKRVL